MPHLFGRDVEHLVLIAPIVVDRSAPGLPFASTLTVQILPGLFTPVSEDEKGVFYQAENGYRNLRGGRPVAGGLYVSKLKPGAIRAYVGDARSGSKGGIEIDRPPLPADALRNLKIGKVD